MRPPRVHSSRDPFDSRVRAVRAARQSIRWNLSSFRKFEFDAECPRTEFRSPRQVQGSPYTWSVARVGHGNLSGASCARVRFVVTRPGASRRPRRMPGRFTLLALRIVWASKVSGGGPTFGEPVRLGTSVFNIMIIFLFY